MKNIVFLLMIFSCCQTISLLCGCGAIKSHHFQTPAEASWAKKVKAGDEAIKMGNYAEAETEYKDAIALNPDSEEARLKLAELYIKTDEIEAAQTQLKESLKINPSNALARNFLGYLHEKVGQNEAAVEQFEESLKLDPDNLYALNHLALVYRHLGRLEAAKSAINKAIQIDPECKDAQNKNAYNYLALIYEAEGDKEAAVEQLRKTLDLFPDDAWTHSRLGSMLEDLGKYREALAEYAQTLKIDPKNALAKSRINSLRASIPTEIKPLEIVVEEAEKIVVGSPDQTHFPEADAVVLLNKVDHEVNANGSSKYTMHQLIKILTQKGASLYGEISIPYNARSQKLWINAAQTLLPDGTVAQPNPDAYHDVTPPDLTSYRMYSDMMYKTISMPALRPGVIIEYQFTVEDAFEGVNRDKIWSWGGIEFQSSEPIIHTKYALKLPKEVQLNWKTYNCEILPTIIEDGFNVIYVWDYKDAPSIEPQLNAEERAEVMPRLAFSTVSSWQEVNDWYQNLIKGRDEIDSQIEAKVGQLTHDLNDENSKMKAIYDFVASQIRYIGIELGAGAYQPYFASEAFKHRYGDCKDKAVLMIGMLKSIGVEAYPALISPAPHYKVDIDLPYPGQFSHLIVALPNADGTYLWLDSTSETCGYFDLPARDQGRLALIVSEDGGKFAQTPLYPAEKNSLSMSAEIQLQLGGSIQGAEKVVASGQYAIKYRAIYKSMKPLELRTQVEKDLNSRYPGAKLEKFEFTALEDLSSPFEAEVEFFCQNYAAKIDSEEDFSHLIFAMPSHGLIEYYSLAISDEERNIIFEHPFQINRNIKLSLPQGYHTIALSDPIDLRWDFGRLNREYTKAEGKVEYRLEFLISEKGVPDKSYSQLKRMLERLGREEREQILLWKL